jgi:hypothetical protein
MRGFDDKKRILALGLTAFLVAVATQCGPAPTATPGSTPTQSAVVLTVATTVATAPPTPVTQPTDVALNVATLDLTLNNVVALVQALGGSGQSLPPDQQAALALQMSSYLKSMANLVVDLEPAFLQAEAVQDQTGPVLDQMLGTTQTMVNLVTAKSATPWSTEVAKPTLGTSAQASQLLLSLATMIQLVADRLPAAQAQGLVSPLGDLTLELSQLVMALSPLLQARSPGQISLLVGDAAKLQLSAQEMLSNLAAATPVPTPAS